MKIVLGLGAALAVLLSVVGCAGSTPTSAASQSAAAIVTATETVTSVTSAAAVTVTAAPAPAPVTAAEPAETIVEPAATAVAVEPVMVVMPDVVCMNLQAAQNAIQDAGVFFSRSEDASGEGRSQLVDSNWVVVAQSPAAGAAVGEAEALLSAVKIGEPSDC